MFGLTLKGDYRGYVRCGDPDSAAHQAIDTLGKLKAALIVGLTHQSIEADRELLAREPTLDLILGGHEHEAHDSVVTNRHVVKADANARSAQFVTLWGGKEKWRQAVGLVPIDNRLPDDSATAEVVHRWEDSLRARLGPERDVATAVDPIDARDVTNRRREGAIGDLVTDAMRAGTGAQVALINAGAMRLDDVIPAGRVSNYQLESIFLFADETRVVSFPLTGARLREVLEHGVSQMSLGKGGFLQVSGIAFKFDPARPSGSRLDGPISGPGGSALGGQDTVRVAFPAFAACEGGDGYKVPEAGSACAAADSAPRAVDLLLRYIADSLGGKLTPLPPGRIRETGKTNPG
jgi:5'-nucleotidase